LRFSKFYNGMEGQASAAHSKFLRHKRKNPIQERQMEKRH
jgi:hypothetical protein